MDFWWLYTDSWFINIVNAIGSSNSCWIIDCYSIFNRCCLWSRFSSSSCTLGKMGKWNSFVEWLTLVFFWKNKQIPASERSTIPPIAQSGTSLGIIFTTPLVSIMIEQNFLGGWPSACYVFG